MNCYVWENTQPVTDRWHENGGLLIIAETLEDAKALWNKDETTSTVSSGATDDDPDHVWEVNQATQPLIIVFPDAGCC